MKTIECDLLVAGAGISGMCAAISAARRDLKVVLINDRSVPGGNASSEIGVKICGSSHERHNAAIYAKETGLIEEVRLRINYYRQGGGYDNPAIMDAVLFDMIYDEKNIQLLPNTIVIDCLVTDQKISAVYARHSVNNTEYEIKAFSYVDATGNGTLAHAAGADFKYGREGKEEFHEYWAPDKADSYTMGNSLYFETEDVGHEVTFKAPHFAYDISKMDFLKDIDKPENFRGISWYGPHWAYEYGGQVDILEENDNVELELRKLVFGIWDYVKNSGKFPEAKNRKLKRVFSKAGSRESRRFIGDYILTENDIENKVEFEDAVAMGGWPMDIHAPFGIYDKLPASNFVPVTGTYSIPFRCLYSKNVDNLMMAGRNISVTHIALGSTRVMGTCGAIGQAVGTAACLLKKYNLFPRELYHSHISELRALLVEDDQSVLHYREEQLKAKVSASEEMIYENVVQDDYLYLERDYALALMLDSKELRSLQIKVKCSRETVLRYKLFTGIHPETFLPEVYIKTGEVAIPSAYEGWITLPIDVPVGEDGKIYLVFEKNAVIAVAVGKKRIMGAITYRMHTKASHDRMNHDSVPLNEEKTGYIAYDHNYEEEKNILFRRIEPEQSIFSPKNVLNGFTRPYRIPNLWLASLKHPQTLTVEPIEPCDISVLEIILDDCLDIDNVDEMPPNLAKKLEIRIRHEGKEIKIQEEDNYRRLLRYRVDLKKVDKIEIRIIETYGNQVGIYAVRYHV